MLMLLIINWDEVGTILAGVGMLAGLLSYILHLNLKSIETEIAGIKETCAKRGDYHKHHFQAIEEITGMWKALTSRIEAWHEGRDKEVASLDKRVTRLETIENNK
jgi:hypothetical protein